MHEVIERFFDPDSHPWAKAAASVFGWLFGTMTLSNLVLAGTFVLTVAQVYFTVRDKWWRDPERRRRAARNRQARRY